MLVGRADAHLRSRPRRRGPVGSRSGRLSYVLYERKKVSVAHVNSLLAGPRAPSRLSHIGGQRPIRIPAPHDAFALAASSNAAAAASVSGSKKSARAVSGLKVKVSRPREAS